MSQSRLFDDTKPITTGIGELTLATNATKIQESTIPEEKLLSSEVANIFNEISIIPAANNLLLLAERAQPPENLTPATSILFSKKGEDRLFSTLARNFSQKQPNFDIPFKALHGSSIYVMVIVNKEGWEKPKIQLRIQTKTTSGHPELCVSKYKASALAAGEIYAIDGKIVLFNNKTGGFHLQFNDTQETRDENQMVINQVLKKILEPFYDSTIADPYFHFTGTSEEERKESEHALAKTLKERKIPFESLNKLTRETLEKNLIEAEKIDLENKLRMKT